MGTWFMTVLKYTKINIDRMSILLNFNPEVSVHLLGVASLNYSGYIREKALKLSSGLPDLKDNSIYTAKAE